MNGESLKGCKVASFEYFESIPDHSICIIYFDSTYPWLGDDEAGSLSLKGKIEQEIDSNLEEVDIYPGASGPGWLLENLVIGLPIAAAITLFFSGKSIVENLEAWSELVRSIRKNLGRKACLNRSAAAALAIDEVLAINGDKLVKSFRLEKYSVADSRFESFEDARPVDENVTLELSGVTTHVFDFNLDGVKYLVVVEGTEVGVRKIS